MRIGRTTQGIIWILVYLLLTLSPLFVMLLEPRPLGRELWREFSVALGFCGLAMMTMQFALTARIKSVKAPFGSDIVYYFHKRISIATFGLILVHPLILFIFSPGLLHLLNIFSAPWRARAGVTSLVALIILIVISVWRKTLKVEYIRWRIWHGILASAAVALAIVHITLVNHYLESPWKKVLWAGYGIFFLCMLAYTRVVKPFLMYRKPYQVIEVIPERGDCWTLVLQPQNHPGMKFMPGQFAWLTAWTSPYKDSEHPFSISSSAQEQDRLTFTIKELGDFSSTIKNVQPGQKVYLDGPFGSFSCDRHPYAEGYIFIAGGVGITPMMSMLRTMAMRNDRRPLLLIYANRFWDGVIFREDIEALKKRLNLKVVHVLEKPPAGWDGETGFITTALLTQVFPSERRSNQYEIFICGPKPMMDAMEKSLAGMKIPPGDYHSEQFDLV